MSRRLLRAAALAGALGLALGRPVPPAGAVPAGREPGAVVRVEHRDLDAAPSRGPASALVTIELFFLPTTNAPSRLPAYRALERLAANHPTQIRILYRVMQRGGQINLPTLMLEAHAQGKFFDVMEELHRNRSSMSLGKNEVIDLARKVGMDAPRFTAILSSARYVDPLNANEQRLQRLMHGTASLPIALFNTRPARTSLSAMSDADYEREYQDAHARALELIDRGVEPRHLLEAFDVTALRGVQPFVIATGPTDEDVGEDASEHRLASPPLQLTGLPSFGKPGARATLPVVILCRPNDRACVDKLGDLQSIQAAYANDIRLVWAPWFDVSRDDAANLTLLGDAVLCAEQIGSSTDLNVSPGWQWLTLQLKRGSARGRLEKLLDEIAAQVDIDPQALAACRARTASTTLGWIERARRSGVTRAPALVIGGRIYEGIPDAGVARQLIEAELAPGVLGELAPAWHR